jgi:hypothetical protein
MFCASIPAALAIGANVHASQGRAMKTALENGEPAAKPKLPAGPATAVLVAGLLAASVLYHTQQGG